MDAFISGCSFLFWGALDSLPEPMVDLDFIYEHIFILSSPFWLFVLLLFSTIFFYTIIFLLFPAFVELV